MEGKSGTAIVVNKYLENIDDPANQMNSLSVGRADCMEESITPHLAALEQVPEQTINVNDSQRLCILSWPCCIGPD